MNSFVLKMVGIFSMLLDHVGKAFLKDLVVLQYIGRLAFPIFAFQIVQGYKYTRDVNKYIKRLLVFALISQVPYWLFVSTYMNDVWNLNIVFTLLLGLLTIYGCDKVKSKWMKVLLVLGVSGVAEIFRVDYGAYGVLTIVMFYVIDKLLADRKAFCDKVIWYVVGMGVFLAMNMIKYADFWVFSGGEYMAEYVGFVAGATSAMLLVYTYNGKLGPKCKYLFYVFYPAHLVVIYLLFLLIK